MPDQTSAHLTGVAGTDASASKRGYYYQDLVTALAWSSLRNDEDLLVEVAEDYAVTGKDHAVVHQVKDVRASLTLRVVLPFLENVVSIIESNPDRSLSFVYRTTGSRGAERDAKAKPGLMPGIQYWDEVKIGADPVPLINALTAICAPTGKLAAYLRANSIDRVVNQLVAQVTWATDEPSSQHLYLEVANRIAAIAHDELDYPWTDGSRLVAVVIDEVTRASIQKEKEKRVLTRVSLINTLKEVTHKSVPFPEWRQLVRDAAKIKNPPTRQVNEDVERRLNLLRRVRMFSDAGTQEQARQLAVDVSEGGSCELADSKLRSTALAWCARVLIEEDEPLARKLINHARQLEVNLDTRIVDALLVGKTDVQTAVGMLADENDPAAQGIRYYLHRRESLANGWSWVCKSRLRPSAFDSDGMYFVLFGLLQEHRWSDASAWLAEIPERAFDSTPALYWAAGLTLLAESVPEMARQVVIEGPPLFENFTLSDEPSALVARRRASGFFRRIFELSEALGVTSAGEDALEYSLWLELKDRITRTAAVSEILQNWEDSNHRSRWLPLVIAARISIDVVSESEKLDARAATYGSLNFYDARARLALLNVTPPSEWIDLWPDIKVQLEPHFTRSFLDLFGIEALLNAGRVAEACSALERSSEMPESARERLLIEIRGDSAALELNEYRLAVEREKSPASLHNALVAAQKAGLFLEAEKYAGQLFALTGDHESAEEWIVLLKRLHRWAEIEQFLASHPEQVEQSHRLAAIYLETLFHNGKWSVAENLLQERPELVADRRQTQLKLAVLSGRWEKLGFMLEEAQADPGLSVDDQRQFARLAHALGRTGISKRLAKEAAKRGSDDPSVLLDCYNLAVQGYWEDDPDAIEWLPKAISLSGPDGPVQSKSLDELIEMAPAWREKTELLSEGLAKGQLYLGLLAQRLNRPLASLMLGASESNRSERDPRKRTAVAAFAGIARDILSHTPVSLTLDQTALLTLAHLRLLPRVLDAFPKIRVAHSIGAWLFAESQDIQFHQPSRVFDAQRLLTAIARQHVGVPIIPAGAQHELVEVIGNDLAELLLLARKTKEASAEAYVVRTAPVYTVRSAMRENADMTAYSDVLRSMLEFVRSLYVNGAISDDQLERATSFLRQHDTGWPHDGVIPAGAVVYLDDVAVAYMHHLNLWDAAAVVFRVMVHPDAQKEASALVQLEGTAQAITATLEDIRRFLVDGQERGVVSFLAQPTRDSDQSENFDKRFLLLQSIEQQEDVQAIVVDDRAANQFPRFTYEDGATVALTTTLSVLDWLRATKMVDEREWLSLRNELRRDGYVFMRIEAEELVSALNASTVRDGRMIESLSARAIRENHLLAASSGMLQLPGEMDWLMNHNHQIIEALAHVWKEMIEDGEAEAKSSWLVELGSWEGFLGRIPGELSDDRLLDLDAIRYGRLLFNNAIPKQCRRRYNNWLEATYLRDLAQSRPLVFEAICNQTFRQLSQVFDNIGSDEIDVPEDSRAAVAADVCKSFVNDLPEIVRERLFDDDEQLGKLGLKRSTRLTVHVEDQPSFDTEAFYNAVASLYEEGNSSVKDVDGEVWEFELKDGLVFCLDASASRRFEVKYGPLVAANGDVRRNYLGTIAELAGLSTDQVCAWVEEVNAAPLSPNRFAALEQDLESSPRAFMARIRELLSSGSAVSHSDLVPLRVAYYQRLVELDGGRETLSQFADIAARGSQDVVLKLAWSAHSLLAPQSAIAEMSLADLNALCDELLPEADLWSLIGLTECVASRSDAVTDAFDVLRRVLEALHEAVSSRDRLALTTALAAMVDAALITSGFFTRQPVYWRRHASFSQAALIERAVLASGVPVGEFGAWARSASMEFGVISLPDLRREPRWGAFMLAAPQLEQELIGRALSSLERNRADFNGKLDDLVFGDAPGTFSSRRNIYFSAQPGPLEGATELASPLPEFLVEQLFEALKDETQPLPHRVFAACHLAGLGAVPADAYAAIETSVEELARSSASDFEKEQWPGLVMRMALSAASSRRTSFGNAVLGFIHARPDISLGLRVFGGITACGCHADPNAWVAAVEGFLSRCTWESNSQDDADELLVVVRALGFAEPLLRPALGPTWARLQGVSQRLG